MAVAITMLAAAYLAGLIATGGAVFRIGLALQPDPAGALARTAEYALPAAAARLPAASPAPAAPPAVPAALTTDATAAVDASQVMGTPAAGCASLAGGRLEACQHAKVGSVTVRPPSH